MSRAEKTSITIVGGGIVGAACALALARADLRPLVIEATTPGCGATAEGMGHLVVLDHDQTTLALTLRSLELWHALAPDLPDAAEWSGAGTLWLAEDSTQLERAGVHAEELRAVGLDARLIAGTELRALEPSLAQDLVGALRVADDRIVYPPVVAAWLLERACALGATLLAGVRLERLERLDDAEELIFADGRRQQSERVILATGLGTGALLPGHALAGAVQPRRGHLLITERTRLKVEHQLVELGYHDSVSARGATSVAFNLQPRPSGQLLLGSSRQDGSADREVDALVIARLIDRGRRFVPGLPAVRGLRAWVGLRPATRDGLPLVGPLPERPSLILACGHEGLGITTSLVTAEIVAAGLGAGTTRVDAHALRPERLLEESALHD